MKIKFINLLSESNQDPFDSNKLKHILRQEILQYWKEVSNEQNSIRPIKLTFSEFVMSRAKNNDKFQKAYGNFGVTPNTDTSLFLNWTVNQRIKYLKSDINFTLQNIPHQYHKSFTNWLLNLYMNEQLLDEDLGEHGIYAELLYDFVQIYPQLPSHDRDIYSYKNKNQLAQTIDLYKIDKPKESVSPYNVPNSIIISDNDLFTVVTPQTEEASCALGKYTKWCTAKYPPGSPNNMFKRYNDRGPLYIIFHKPDNTRYQYHPNTNQFKDEDDVDVHYLPDSNKRKQLFDIIKQLKLSQR